MIVKWYRKKPVEVLALEWTGENKVDVQRFVGRYLDLTPRGLKIPTLEGDHFASVGDFIIQGVNGEFYPCKPDIFWKTYDEVKVDHIREATKMIEPGARFPCKEGDTVYQLAHGYVETAVVHRVETVAITSLYGFGAKDIGKTVFLDRADADAALRRRLEET